LLFALVTGQVARITAAAPAASQLAAVIEKIYPHIPAIIRFFLPADALVRLIEKALEQAKQRWEENPALLAK
jgi:uncharacterized membrane protein